VRALGISIVLCAIAAGGVSGCAGGGATKVGVTAPVKPIVLTFASTISGGQPPVLEDFAQDVARRSHGSVRIDFKPDWRAGDVRQEQETIGDVRAGKVDLGWVGSRAWAGLGIHDFDALVAPFLIDSYALEAAVFRAGIPQRMLPAVRRADVVPVGVLPGPLRQLLTVRRPIVRPPGFRGQAVGVIGAVAAATFRSLGARPSPVYAQTPLGTLDAAEMQSSAVSNMQYDQTAGYLVANANLWPRPLVLIAAPRVFRALAPVQRAALRDAAAAVAVFGVRLAKQDERDAVGELCRRGRISLVAITSTQRRALREATRSVYSKLERIPATRSYIREIEALKDGRASESADRCAAANATAFGHGVSPLDGAWEMRASADYLIRHHPRFLPPPTRQDVLLDSGWYRFVFGHGRVTSTHGAPLLHTRSTGVFRVRGNTIEMQFTAGHDAGGLLQRYTWSLYRGALTFLPVGRSVANPALAPWHRLH
jgi:TRAP-type transport system periplasmic protein